MKKTVILFLGFIFIISLNQVIAKPSMSETYVKFTCYNISVVNKLGVAHFLLDPNSPFPNPADLAALDRNKYNRLIAICSDHLFSIHPKLKLDVVSYSASKIRQDGEGCTTNTQCSSGYCNLSLGNCSPCSVNSCASDILIDPFYLEDKNF